MAKAFRFLGGLVTGLFIAFILLGAVEVVSAILHPFPADFRNTMEEMHQHVARYPHWMLAVVVPTWGLIAFLSMWTAKRIGGRGAAFLLGLLLIVGVLFNVSMLPYPIWFKIVSVAVILLAVVVANQPAGSADGNR